MSTSTATKAPTKPAAKKAAPAKAPAQPAKKVATSNRRTTRKAAPKPTAGLAAAAATGKVKFYRQRANRTLRFLPYYAPGTDSRKSAELVQKRRDNGETIGAIAEDMHTSVATVRRLITGLLLAQAVEAGEYDAKWDKATNEVIVNGTGR